MGKVTERIINAERVEDLISVFGSFDENARRIEDELGVCITLRFLYFFETLRFLFGLQNGNKEQEKDNKTTRLAIKMAMDLAIKTAPPGPV